jgi:hypothetical protein
MPETSLLAFEHWEMPRRTVKEVEKGRKGATQCLFRRSREVEADGDGMHRAMVSDSSVRWSWRRECMTGFLSEFKRWTRKKDVKDGYR